MIETRVSPKAPFGQGGELERYVNNEQGSFLTRFAHVKNRVVEVNPYVLSPLNLTVGEPSPLGLFSHSWTDGSAKKETHLMECWTRHNRSSLLGRALFGDTEGRVYRDIDLKGIGHLGFQKVLIPGSIRELQNLNGLLDESSAYFEYQLSEEFINAGIRTNRVIGIIKLEELVLGNNLMSVAKARKEHVIKDPDGTFNPVILIRAFVTKARIDDLLEGVQDSGFRRLLIEDAKALVSRELGREKVLSDEEYAVWFTKTLGENVALMHKNGWAHNYLYRHNITLDSRIVDLDGVSRISEYDRKRDLSSAVVSLFSLISKLHPGFSPSGYEEIFQTAYGQFFLQ